MRTNRHAKCVLLAATALSMAHAIPAFAQDAGSTDSEPLGANDIIVTAQRVQERLQDVPISITVFNQEQLANNNIVAAKDLAAITPGLTVSTRYGNDATTFTIRGFSQELRTTPTVATYFADIVAPRGSGVNTGGDGAGPGQLFDLQNVQVLKGPQGTLFGRNTTGGAVLLVPKKPTRSFEGYVEGSIGEYDLRRVQAVVNIPVNDKLRFRFGLDRNMRDGYLHNLSPFGRKDFANVDYWAARASMVAELSPDLENYTIFSYNKSKSAGTMPAIKRCFTAGGVTEVSPVTAGSTSTVTSSGMASGTYACQQIAREAASGFWTVENSVADAKSEQEQWQVINTTTWHVSDTLTIKNNFAYAEFRSATNMDLYGTYFPLVAPSAVTSTSQILSYVPLHGEPSSGLTNAQSSLVEELQLQGRSSNDKFNWQAGLYYEMNKPIKPTGVQNPQWTPCADINTLNCTPAAAGVSAGVSSWALYSTTFRGMAAYAQASYALSDKVKITGGIRYTNDKTRGDLQLGTIRIPAAPASPYFVCTNTSAADFNANTADANNPDHYAVSDRYNRCMQHDSKTTKAPTWLIDIDYKPWENVLLYIKWSRGYRQGGLAPASADTARHYDAEKVESYETGAKTSWRGSMPGSFNISGFYNDFTNQQLQLGLNCSAPCTPTTAIVNVGSSRIFGIEAEASLSPFRGLRLDASYAYLNSKMLRAATPSVPGYTPIPILAGSELPFAMPHKLTLSGTYMLPLPESIGKVSIGGTFIHQSKYKVSTTTVAERGYLPAYSWGNVNVTWEGIGGLPVDAGFFVNNVTNKQMYSNVIDASMRQGFIAYVLSEPRMYGVRLKYRFGN